MAAILQVAASPSRHRIGNVILMQDHDLPLLAAESVPRDPLDWESLLEVGVMPGLLAGTA